MRYLPILFLALFAINANGQFYTQSAEGKSSIPLPLNGIGIGVDIGKSEVAFGVNNYAKVLDSRSRKFKDNYFLGMNLSAKNEDGLAKLFSSGDIVPAGNFLGFFGWSWSDNHRIIRKFTGNRSSDRIGSQTRQCGPQTKRKIAAHT